MRIKRLEMRDKSGPNKKKGAFSHDLELPANQNRGFSSSIDRNGRRGTDFLGDVSLIVCLVLCFFLNIFSNLKEGEGEL